MNLKNKKVMIALIPAVFMALAIIYLYGGTYQFGIEKFNRIIGTSVVGGVDISARITRLYLYGFVILPLAIIGAWYVSYIVMGKSKDERPLKLLNVVSIVSLVALIFNYLYFNTADSQGIGKRKILILVCVALSIYAFIVLQNKSSKFTYEKFSFSLLASFPLTLMMTIVMYKFGHRIEIIRLSMIYTLLVWAIFFVMTFVMKKVEMKRLRASFIFVMMAPIFVSVFLELCNILNQHNVFITRKVFYTVLIYLVSMALTAVVYKLASDKFIEKIDYGFYYSAILIGLSMICNQLALQTVVGNLDFFETANHGATISELFKYGKLPLVESFDAHMLCNSFGMIVYNLFNQDISSAIYIGYSIEPIVIYWYYKLLTKFFSKEEAFVFTLAFPIYNELARRFWFGYILILAFLYVYKKKTWQSYVLFWLAAALTALNTLDLGFAFILGSLIVWGILFFLDKESVSIKKMILSGAGVFFSFLAVFSYFCIKVSISPIEKIKEVLGIASSNVNWGYSGIGPSRTYAYMLGYVFIPVIVTLIMLFLVYHMFKNKNKIDVSQYAVLLILFFAFTFNFSRGIVRHNIAEGTLVNVVSVGIVFICLTAAVLCKRAKYVVYTVSSVVLMCIMGLTMGTGTFEATSLLNFSLDRHMSYNQYDVTPTKKVDRVQLTDEVKNVYKPLEEVFDQFLAKDETYLDFTNQTLFYSLLDREKPVYINQSPGLLSGEFTQEKFIEQVESKNGKVVFALMPLNPVAFSYDLDAVRNAYRYYLVSEYISENYVPFLQVTDYAIWCRKDRIDEMKKLYKQSVVSKKENISIADIKEAKVKPADMDLSYNKDSMMIVGGNEDPSIHGIEKIAEIKNAINDSKFIKLSMNVKVTEPQAIQIYYTTEKGEQFSEEKSVIRDISKSGSYEISIPCSEHSMIRLDTSMGKEIEIKNMQVAKGDEELQLTTLIDHNYANSVGLHNYSLGQLPYIWANYDEIKLADKKEQADLMKQAEQDKTVLAAGQAMNIPVDLSKVSKKNGNYLNLNLDTEADAEITVSLGKTVKEEFVPLVVYTFSSKDAKASDYLLRVSSDFLWYTNEIKEIQVQSNSECTVNKLKVLQGDTLESGGN